MEYTEVMPDEFAELDGLAGFEEADGFYGANTFGECSEGSRGDIDGNR